MQYGLLYHSTFIGRAGPKHKGRISRFLANKCSIASRIDCYSGELLVPKTSSDELTRISVENPTAKFGEALRAQVEQRLVFFEKGEPPTKNSDVIQKVLQELAAEQGDEDGDVDMDAEPAMTTLDPSPPPKKEKKKKRKVDDMDDREEEEPKAKKAKLSKEEKKALKRAMKEQAQAAEVS